MMRRFAVGLQLLAFATVGCSGVSTQTPTTGEVTVTEVVPAQGPLAGNVPIQIKGTGFIAGNLLVTFGGTTVPDAQVVDATTIHGTLPARSQAGLVDVVVACEAGQATLDDGFEYHDAAALSITGLNPPNGPITGGTTVTITGTGFSGGTTAVSFGGVGGTGVTVADDTSLTVLTPAAAAAGPVAVAITNNNGTASLPNAFVYGDGTVTPGGTVTESLGGITEFNHVTQGSDPAHSQGYAIFYTMTDTLYPAPGTCQLDLNQLPGVTTTLDAGANVTVSQSTTSLLLPKDVSNGYPMYVQNNGPAANFVMGQMAGVTAPGAGGGVAAFNAAAVASAPSMDYQAWLDPFNLQSFSGGGFWNGASDLWLTWDGTGSPVNHVQIFVVGADLGGATHVLQCDIRDGGDAGAFCVKGGGGSDICQTPGATMTDFWNAIQGPVLGFGNSNVILYRGNRSTYQLPSGANAALDVSIVKVGSLIMGN